MVMALDVLILFSFSFSLGSRPDYFPMKMGLNIEHYSEGWKAKGRVEEWGEVTNRKKRGENKEKEKRLGQSI